MGVMPDQSDAVAVTVGQAAASVGVSVRTLHHWDQIGLARPSERSRAGYRLYTDTDVERLRRIVIYRELGLDLAAIRGLLDDTTGALTELRDQRARLAERIRQLTALGDDLDRMIDAHEHGVLLAPDDQATVFGPGWNPEWPGQARELYGDTAQWQQYAERSAVRDTAQWKQVDDANTAIERELAAAVDAGITPGSAEACALVDRHREVFSAYFPITRQMQVLLGRMYETDPAYATHYNTIRPGLASWLRHAIDASARTHGIDPEQATWK